MNPIASKSFASLVVVILCVITLNVSESHAQLLVGPRIGGQMSWVNYENDLVSEIYDVEPLYGYFGGITVGFKVRKRFFLMTDFIYSRKGTTIKGNGDASLSDPELNYTSVTHHFDVPIIYRIDFKKTLGKNLVFKYFLGAGPNVSYWWKGNGTLVSGDLMENNVEELEYDVKFESSVNTEDFGTKVVNNANRIQLGINFATGFVFEPSRGGIYIIDFRFELGHSYNYKDTPAQFVNVADFTDPANGRNMGFRLGFAYLLDTKIAERKKGKSTDRNR